MKQATCKELKGVCDEIITGVTAEELGENSKNHVMRMVMQGDKAHQDAVQEMMMLSKVEQTKFYADFKNNFNNLKDIYTT